MPNIKEIVHNKEKFLFKKSGGMDCYLKPCSATGVGLKLQRVQPYCTATTTCFTTILSEAPSCLISSFLHVYMPIRFTILYLYTIFPLIRLLVHKDRSSKVYQENLSRSLRGRKARKRRGKTF